MLVSKIKPCMSKYKQVILRNCEWLIKSAIIYLMVEATRITVVILELIRATGQRCGAGGGIRSKANRLRAWQVSHDT